MKNYLTSYTINPDSMTYEATFYGVFENNVHSVLSEKMGAMSPVSIIDLADAMNGNVVVKCSHCGQWGAIKTECKHCGAPI